MDMIAENVEGVVLRLTETELRIFSGSLSEVIHGIHIPESEFEDRLGGSREEVGELLDGINGPQSIGADGLTFRLGSSDLVLLRNAMVEMTKGVEMEAWEYPIRLGATVAEGQQLLGEIEALMETNGPNTP